MIVGTPLEQTMIDFKKAARIYKEGSPVLGEKYYQSFMKRHGKQMKQQQQQQQQNPSWIPQSQVLPQSRQTEQQQQQQQPPSLSSTTLEELL